jgi:deazaflavin-dependent oxidoreductase (nitroreductase family)
MRTTSPVARTELLPQVTLSSAKNRIRFFNRRILNPFTLSFAGRRRSPYAIVQHTGRRTGQHYATPVVARPSGNAFIVPLPYGVHVDWCMNVMAAEGCLIAFHGRCYRVSDPEIVDAAAAKPAFPRGMWALLRRANTRHFLRIKRVSDSPESEACYHEIIAAYPGARAARVVVVAAGLIAASFVLAATLGNLVRHPQRAK